MQVIQSIQNGIYADIKRFRKDFAAFIEVRRISLKQKNLKELKDRVSRRMAYRLSYLPADTQVYHSIFEKFTGRKSSGEKRSV